MSLSIHESVFGPRAIRWFDIDGRLIDAQEDCF